MHPLHLGRKIIYKRTYSFLENTGQLYNSQYGFRQGHSCENAISELLAEIIKSKTGGIIHSIYVLGFIQSF